MAIKEIVFGKLSIFFIFFRVSVYVCVFVYFSVFMHVCVHVWCKGILI